MIQAIRRHLPAIVASSLLCLLWDKTCPRVASSAALVDSTELAAGFRPNVRLIASLIILAVLLVVWAISALVNAGKKRPLATAPNQYGQPSHGYPAAQPVYGPRLVGLVGPMMGREFAIAAGITVGQEGMAHIGVRDPNVSPQHAWFGPGPDGRVSVRDGSTTGTWVNNQRVQHQAPLNPGDVIALGSMQIQFRFMV